MYEVSVSYKNITKITLLYSYQYYENDKELTPDVGPFDGAPKGDRDGCEVEGLREGCLVG